MLKGRVGLLEFVGKGEPELQELKLLARLSDGHLFVRDAGTRGHQRDVTGLDHGDISGAVFVTHLPTEEVGEGREASVRVFGHPRRLAHIHRPTTIEKDEGTHHLSPRPRKKSEDWEGAYKRLRCGDRLHGSSRRRLRHWDKTCILATMRAKNATHD